ncbi:hypothetical protein RRG08_015175 [Elysia crispata]|uniref:Uncharacterized protein n=1 Tax=Elysia crispata TaxID=231223 RepID=A0AAE0YB59_9GAST|nr:hypothetical protein RRG08_015175 [Elysia crispata]
MIFTALSTAGMLLAGDSSSMVPNCNISDLILQPVGLYFKQFDEPDQAILRLARLRSPCFLFTMNGVFGPSDWVTSEMTRTRQHNSQDSEISEIQQGSWIVTRRLWQRRKQGRRKKSIEF